MAYSSKKTSKTKSTWNTKLAQAKAATKTTKTSTPGIAKNPKYNWSEFQKAIFNDIATGTGHTVVIARAGCAKTSSLVEGASHIPPNKKNLMVAFNKAIAEELKVKVGSHIDVMTLHSLGYKAVRRNFPNIELDNFKTQGLVKTIIGDGKETWEKNAAICKCVSLAKGSLADTPEKIKEIIIKFDIETQYEEILGTGINYEKAIEAQLNEFVSIVLKTLELCKKYTKTLDFDDMVWFPYVFNMSLSKYDYVFVDECQDLNACQMYLVHACLTKNSRVIAVGDPCQCVEENTHIDVFDPIDGYAKWTKIKDIKQGDLVESFIDNKYVFSKVLTHKKSLENSGITIQTEFEKSISMTNKHRIWVLPIDKSITTEETLKVGDETLFLLDADQLAIGDKVAITTIGYEVETNLTYNKPYLDKITNIYQDTNKVYYDIEVENAHNFFGNGILSHNCIYAFRGADSDSMLNLVERLGAKILTLPISYRCPLKVIKLAQTLVPDIQPTENAPDGSIFLIEEKDIIDHIKPGDFLVSRVNSPLIKHCMNFLKNGIPANIKGRDIGANLSAMIKKSKTQDVQEFRNFVNAWKNKEVDRLLHERKDTTATEDKAECLLQLSEEAEDVSEIKERIDRLFKDVDDSKKVMLGSTHKMKGLEANRVFVLQYTYRHKKNKEDKEDKEEDEEVEEEKAPIITTAQGNKEEDNLYYVAVTRAKQELFLVKSSKLSKKTKK